MRVNSDLIGRLIPEGPLNDEEITSLIDELAEYKKEKSRITTAVMFFLVAVLFANVNFIFFNEDKIDIFGFNYLLNHYTVLGGFIVGNLLTILHISSLARIVIFERAIVNLTQKYESDSLGLLKITQHTHYVTFFTAIDRYYSQTRSPLEYIVNLYIRFIPTTVYTSFYSFVLIYFSINLIIGNYNIKSQDLDLYIPFLNESLGVVLILMNVVIFLIGYYVIGGIGPATSLDPERVFPQRS